jgi:hypothetical protein
VCCLANQAGRFVLSVCVDVDGDLCEKHNDYYCQHEGQGSRVLPYDFAFKRHRASRLGSLFDAISAPW